MSKMTAYQFTKYQNDRTHLLKAKGYDIDTVAFMIDYNNPGKNYFRDTAEYEDAKDVFYEVTSSCDKDEAIHWMQYFMLNAIAYGYTKDLNWRTYFMAAYDIFISLTDGKYTASDKQAKFAQTC